MPAFPDVHLLSRSHSTTLLRPRPLSEYTPNSDDPKDLPRPDRVPDLNPASHRHEPQKPRAPRKPSPGLAARLKALGFGRDSTSPSPSASTSPSADRIGRIPEDQIRQLDYNHRATSASSTIIPRGRAWSGSTSGHLTPQVTGDGNNKFTAGDSRVFEGGTRRTFSITSSGDTAMATHTEQIEMDAQKYRLPDHTNGNGTKAMSDTKQAHIERETPPVDYDTPPTPISKDSPGEFTGDVSSYFNPFGLQRAGSVYTLSRASFADQLAQLTSLQLPDAELLSTKVSEIPTSKAAARALMGAAEQIRSWISKAFEVIAGLDGEDDVEWAAAGGREGLGEVDTAITKFEELIKVYVSAIESLQSRQDISSVPAEDLKQVVLQVENILSEWEKIRKTLRGVKNSVEIAMEWEELWNTVLGDIGDEMDVLVRLVFEMEEKRHKSLMTETGGDGFDIKELENIVDETPPSKTRIQANTGLSIRASFPLTPNSPQAPTIAQDDSSLLALFARMQPLRASLDFLPMRLSTFHARAEKIFPTACEELETRRAGLEKKWKDLEKDADTLRRELGEDRWVLVFRGAGRQAQKMYESVDRSITKLKESIDNGDYLNNPANMAKRTESYEAKKVHYGPAIERVLSIIDNGVKDRLTVNGEILRLYSDLQRRWEAMKAQMSDIDASLEEIQADQGLRDSISSMLSIDRSTVGSLNDTPGSSPASSIVMTGVSRELDPLTPVSNRKLRPSKQSSLPRPDRNRNVSAPAGLGQKVLTSRMSMYSASKQDAMAPASKRLSRISASDSLDTRPRWNSSVNTNDLNSSHSYKPPSLNTPTPHRNRLSLIHSNNSGTSSRESKIPLRSPPRSGNTTSTIAEKTPSRTSTSRLAFRDRTPNPGSQARDVPSSSSAARPRHLSTQSSMSALSSVNRRSSLQPQSSDPTTLSSSPSGPTTRSASSMAVNRRVSLLPLARGRRESGVNGRESPQAIAGAASAMRRGSSQTSTDSRGRERKPWRP